MKDESVAISRYLQIKAACPDALLFLRIGDFCEAFDEDAQVLQRNLIAAARPVMFSSSEHLMAGVVHAAFPAICEQLLAQGYRVVLCEDVPEKPEQLSLFA